MMIDEFLGHPYNYWVELEKRVVTLEATKWLQEIADLSSKVYFYESRLKEMEEFKKSREGP